MANMAEMDSNVKLKSALRYAELGYYVFPLHNITEHGVCSCKEKASCKYPGIMFQLQLDKN